MAEKKGYQAHAKYILISPTKVRRVANEIRKRTYPEAMAILENLPHKGAGILRKVVKSAASNALYLNKNLDEDMLYISDLQVNEGPRLKRIWRRARGRADVLLKRMSHVSVTVDEIAGKGE